MIKETLAERADRIMADYYQQRGDPSMGSVTTDFDKGFIRAKECHKCGASEREAAYQNDEAVGWFCAACETPWRVTEEEMTKGTVQIQRNNRSVEENLHRLLELGFQFTRLSRRVTEGELRVYIALCQDFTEEDLREAPELFEGVDLTDEEIGAIVVKVRDQWVDGLCEIGAIRKG